MSPVEKNHAAGWNAAVAAQIRAERAAAGLTLDQLAEKSGIPKRTLIRLINAERAIDVAHLAAVAEVFDLSLAELLDRARSRVVTVATVLPLRRKDLSDPASTMPTMDELERADSAAFPEKPDQGEDDEPEGP